MSKTIDILKEIALKEYYDYGKGVNFVIKADPYFAKNNANRMKGVRSGGTFNMYHNERFYHLMGFIDALHWAHEEGYLPDFFEDTESTREFESLEDEQEYLREEQEYMDSLSPEELETFFAEEEREQAIRELNTKALNSLMAYFATGEL